MQLTGSVIWFLNLFVNVWYFLSKKFCKKICRIQMTICNTIFWIPHPLPFSPLPKIEEKKTSPFNDLQHLLLDLVPCSCADANQNLSASYDGIVDESMLLHHNCTNMTGDFKSLVAGLLFLIALIMFLLFSQLVVDFITPTPWGDHSNVFATVWVIVGSYGLLIIDSCQGSSNHYKKCVALASCPDCIDWNVQ